MVRMFWVNKGPRSGLLDSVSEISLSNMHLANDEKVDEILLEAPVKTSDTFHYDLIFIPKANRPSIPWK